jgi:hypothetical protein
MPVGFIFNSNECEVIRRAFENAESDAEPEIQNNLVLINPRRGMEILMVLGNGSLDEEDQLIADRIVSRLAEWLVRKYGRGIFDSPPSPQQDLFKGT